MKTRKNKLRTIALIAAVTLLGAMANIQRVHAAVTIPVTSTADDGSPGTLRAALASATDGDTIDATGLSGTIVLTNGELVVSDSVAIRGPGPANLTVDANHLSRVFHINPGLTVGIDGLKIINGLASGTNFPNFAGNGIYNDHSVLTVSNCTLSGNSDPLNAIGGGIYNNGRGPSSNATLTVIASTISGNSAARGGGVYNDGEAGSAILTIDHSTIAGNSSFGGGGGIESFSNRGGNATVSVVASAITGNFGLGGAGINSTAIADFIPSSATLTMTDSIVSSNSAGSVGGGIFSAADIDSTATATISGCILSGNSAGGGGGIFTGGNATFAIANSTLSGNFGEFSGGAIYNDAGFTNFNARLTIVNSTLSGNSAVANGGAIFNDGRRSGNATVALGNCTLSGNFAKLGGAIVTDTDVGIANVKVLGCTLVGNSGSILVGGIASSGLAEIGNTILQDGAGGNLFGNITSLGFNLSSDGGGGYLTGTGDQINKDPLLGPLANNGGPTLTHLPMLGSPVLDKGSSATLALFGLTTDQRGLPRTVDDPAIPNAPFGDGTDIGAVEGAAPPPPPVQHADLLLSLGVDKTSVKQGEQLTYTITVRNFGPDTAANVIVNDTLSSGSTFVSAHANRGNFTHPGPNQTGTVTWNLGDLDNGDAEGAQLVVKVIVKGKTTITNTATASTSSSDPNLANNSAAITTSVTPGGGGGKK